MYYNKHLLSNNNKLKSITFSNYNLYICIFAVLEEYMSESLKGKRWQRSTRVVKIKQYFISQKGNK